MTSSNPEEVLALAGKIQLLLMDVDGVLTNGRLYNVPTPKGRWSKPRGSIHRMESVCSG